MRRLKSRSHISKMVFSPDSRYLFAIGGQSKGVTIWDLQTGKVHQKLYLPTSLSNKARTVKDLAFCYPNKLILGGENGGYPLYVWDWPCETDAEPTKIEIDGHRYSIRSVQNNNYLLIESFNEVHYLWNPITEQLQDVANKEWYSYSSAEFNYDGKLLGWLDYNHLLIYSTAKENRIEHDQAPVNTISVNMNSNVIRFHPSENLVAVVEHMQVRIFDALTGNSIGPTLYHDKTVKAIEFTPDGTKLLSICGAGQLHIWNASTHVKLTSYDFGLGFLNCLAVAPDSLTCAIGGAFQEIVVVDLDS